MADIADKAQQQSDLALNVALQNIRKQKPDLLFTGSCYYCDALLDKGCFCDADCRDDYEKHHRNLAK